MKLADFEEDCSRVDSLSDCPAVAEICCMFREEPVNAAEIKMRKAIEERSVEEMFEIEHTPPFEPNEKMSGIDRAFAAFLSSIPDEDCFPEESIDDAQ